MAELSSERMNICKHCEKYKKTLKQCSECGCFMPLKTRVAHAKCPLNKW